ncbi:MAG: cytochrome c oxidase subunit II [Acidobacteriota bacterium]|nr:cytochrome c oxidase subunit II [Acidobacteriota bacterium]
MLPKFIPIFPDQASTIAKQVDGLYAYMLLVSAFFSLLIAFLVIFFAIKYRRRSNAELPKAAHGGLLLEITWSVIPLGISMVMFAWGTSIFFTESRPPDDSMEVYVTGKQWMWKIQHMEGQREINELHIPVNRNIKLTMTSEDVIHDFFVPAFRTKSDVLPGRYTTEWFRPTKVGQYHIFCAEYCGTNHSGMVGTVYVMDPAQYDNWLGGGGGMGSMSQKGEALFQQLGCVTCHQSDGKGRCPNLVGLYGTTVRLEKHAPVTADAPYIRESILYPQAKVVEGYQPIMPTFQGLVTEDGILELIEYVKSIGPKNKNTPAGGAAAGATTGGPATGGVTSGSRPMSPEQIRTNPGATSLPKNR